MRFRSLVISLFLLPLLCHADDSHRPLDLRAFATTDSTVVHPDNIFEVTLALENPTDTVEVIKISETGWDHLWKSDNRQVTWDAWDSDRRDQITVEIRPHQKYLFPQPLRMFVQPSFKKTRVTFRMGFRAAGAFGKTFWSDPVGLDVTP